MVNFGPVKPEIEVWEICTFEKIRQKASYLTEYLNNYWTYLHQRFSFDRQMYGDYTSGSAMAEGPRDALVSRNSATTKHPIWKLEFQVYRMALFVCSYV